MTARLTFEDSLAAILDALEQMVERPVSGPGVSSLEIENMAKGPPKITSKSYGDPLTREQIDAALDAHAYACREAERRQMAGWQETVDMLREASGDSPLASLPDFDRARV